MAKKKHIIEFPVGRGGYWYLFWIGKVRYTNKQRKVDFYFYNKMTLDESFINNIDYNNWVVKSLPVSYLSEYGIGSVYDVMNQKLLTLPYENSYQINIDDIFRMTQNEFPLNGNKYFIRNSEQIVDLSFKYLKVIGKNRFNDRKCLLISPYTILQYLFFYNDKLITKAFSADLLSGFKLNEMKTYNGHGIDLGKKIGEIHYDASKLTKQEAIILAPYLFLKNERGIKFLRSIYSHVHEAFFNTSKGEEAVYLNIFWEFKNYSLSVCGKALHTFDPNGKKVDYLLAYRITHFTLLDQHPYTVDEIKLFPFNARDSTKDRENHDPIDVIRPMIPLTDGLSLNLTRDTVNNAPAGEFINNEEFRNPFHIPVTIEKRNKQNESYSVKHSIDDNQKDDVTREIENLSEFADSVRENIKNLIITIGNFEYFKKVIIVLKEEYLTDSNFGVKEFQQNELMTPFQFVEISYLNRFIYIVEFGNGIIGVFNKETYTQIPTEDLSLFSSEFKDYENEIKNTSKVLWTYIRNHYSRDYIAKGIVIQLGAKHDRPRKDEGSITNKEELIAKAASRTAKKLYETRIISNIL